MLVSINTERKQACKISLVSSCSVTMAVFHLHLFSITSVALFNIILCMWSCANEFYFMIIS